MSVKEILHEQRLDLPVLTTKENCQGKVFIVTGSNIGLGLEAAKHLVQASAARVIMAVRNVKAGEEAKGYVERTTGIRGVAEVWPLDLSSYKSVQEFAKRATELDRIDCLLENA
jgi:NAD(P)-dependent dehydrogenase (short-subunit alcohol dehydrogenase family)